jgi:transketolase
MSDSRSIANLERTSAELRLQVIEMSNRAETAHLGGALSVMDILTAIYWGGSFDLDASKWQDPGRDHVVFSKGHAVSALYAALARKGYFPESELLRYNEEEYHLPEQPSPGCVPGVEWATGSLGHGLGVGIGMALAARIQGHQSRTVVVMSDGECQEGSVWEAAMFAPVHKLDKLIAFVDFNQWQATARSCETMQMDPLMDKWKAFGWNAIEVDGHSIGQLLEALETYPDTQGRPTAIVCRTVKGKGVSFIEDDNNWHYRSPSDDEVQEARKQLLGA